MFLPLSVCRGMVLSNEGQPGVAVAHIADMRASAHEMDPTPEHVQALNEGSSVELQTGHPMSIIKLLSAAAERFGDPKNMKLKLLCDLNEEGSARILGVVDQAKKKGLILDWEVVRRMPGHIYEVDATTGKLTQTPLEDLSDQTYRNIFHSRKRNTQWEE